MLASQQEDFTNAPGEMDPAVWHCIPCPPQTLQRRSEGSWKCRLLVFVPPKALFWAPEAASRAQLGSFWSPTLRILTCFSPCQWPLILGDSDFVEFSSFAGSCKAFVLQRHTEILWHRLRAPVKLDLGVAKTKARLHSSEPLHQSLYLLLHLYRCNICVGMSIHVHMYIIHSLSLSALYLQHLYLLCLCPCKRGSPGRGRAADGRRGGAGEGPRGGRVPTSGAS